MYKRHETGKNGEDIATEYLENLGYKIIERNFDCKQGEIDIIAIDKAEIVFVEVKTRTNIKYGQPAEAVDCKKKKHLIKAIKYYIYRHNLLSSLIRIDVIEIYMNKKNYTVNHIKKAILDC